jgi:sugar lactone lactonase YvrE
MPEPRPRRTRATLAVALAVGALLAASCSSADDTADEPPRLTTTSPTPEGEGDESGSGYLVFGAQGNHLDAYEPEPPFEHQRVISAAEEDPDNGRDINGQICFLPDGSRRFVAGEDTDQDQGVVAGWGVFQLTGEGIGDFETRQVGKLVPTYQPSDETDDNDAPYGCGFLSDGRLVTTDVGNQAVGDPTGQLTLWFPPFEGEEVSFCKLDVAIATAQSIWVDDQDRIYVSSARAPTAGIWRYSGPYPTSDEGEGGCGRTDGTGAPLADEDQVRKELFIEPGENDLVTPSGVAGGGEGQLYVASVLNGVINEYDENGGFVRTILKPGEAEEITEENGLTTGTPLGMAVSPEGTLWYADIGLRIRPSGLPGPGPQAGSVRRIVFADGEPLPPETVASDLAFPDAIGLLVLGGGGAASRA